MLRIKKYWQSALHHNSTNHLINKKHKLFQKRNVQLLDVYVQGERFRTYYFEGEEIIEYYLHIEYLLKQEARVYIEETIYPIRAIMNEKSASFKQHIIRHSPKQKKAESIPFSKTKSERENERFIYNRREAVRYAELWWNSYNPKYKNFSVNCTNYVSQCLFAGGAPMWGTPNRSEGWWYTGKEDGWSFSWAVAHSLMWYLAGSDHGLQAVQKERASDLTLGDVICYDFSGDDRWDHTTIVTSKDASGEPLVNAHTDFSRHRYWSYEDSLAWTENCQYKFFHIIES